MVTRHEDVEAVLRDPDRFSSRINNETMGPVMGTLILGMDGDEHRRYRSLVAQAFRPSALARWEEELIGPIIDGLLDDLAPKGRGDLVSDVTSRYPVQVIAGVLGVPVSDHEQFHRWAIEISLGPEDYSVSKPASEEMRAVSGTHRRRTGASIPAMTSSRTSSPRRWTGAVSPTSTSTAFSAATSRRSRDHLQSDG